MRFSSNLLRGLAIAFFAETAIAASWGFSDATLTIQGKGTGVGGGLKEKLSPNKALSQSVDLGAKDTLKILLTTQDDKSQKRPHQAFLSLREPETGLETSYVFSLKESGKGKVELTQDDLPAQFRASSQPLEASIIVASFGSSKPYKEKAFDISIISDPNVATVPPEKPLRYGKLEEIHHIFHTDPKSPPKIITIFFTICVLAALPVLFGVWLLIGANINHLPKALQAAPIAHVLFFGSIIAMEGVFFMYYTSWNLFHTLPVAVGVGVVTFISGSRALTEVQERRLAGLR
ncbi:MAG: hypothetical protein M1834_003636 [Cirrosporium novae-zelandiae]|nr:MAG: hypothetical protein M1834_003636 [Cirrosporium novae-zelandiae]